MPYKRINPAKKALKPCNSPHAKVESKAAAEEAANKVFTTFTTDAMLREGLNIVRILGGGRYEIISLDAVSQNVIGSVETAALIKSVPDRQDALQIGKKRWEAAILKCDVAVRITIRDLFRFFKLPLELRYKIYEFALINPKGMSLRSRNRELAKPFKALSLMLTCRQIYEESKQFFSRNNFFLDHWAVIELREKTDFAKKLEEIELHWEGKWADPAILTSIGEYPNLRVLHVKFWGGSINLDRHINRNKLFQTEENFKWFSKVRGFDQLLSIRGLEHVIFDIWGEIDVRYKNAAPKVQKAFVELLNRELTKPRPTPVSGTRVVRRRARNRNARAAPGSSNRQVIQDPDSDSNSTYDEDDSDDSDDE